MEDIILFCKSYHQDAKRFRRLAESVRRYNREAIPLYVAYPQADEEHFTETVREFGLTALHEEAILALTKAASKAKDFAPLTPNVLQQVTKSEVWRLGICRNFVMIDSDSYFIRDFYRRDFLFDADTPYTIMNEGRHQRDWAARAGREKFLRQYTELRERGRKLFGREGLNFDFAPTPCIHSCKVWEALYETYAKPRGISFYEQIVQYPCETQWYGEFLLTHPVIRLIPREPLFKAWGFREQWEEGARLGETEEVLAINYLGIVEQSNWNYDLDCYRRPRRSWRTFFLKR